ncbi:8306_t:CDS:1 [Ambispora gerdemannii]|uniref:8306_t:CDS:1 n=1 Tax=Ambispora gerdemannii TaxID=144530 RepID=A0A9N9CVC6_9GLOM|nr:8306_t:CDS:1 [Ambispora gerdemannii]
MNVGKLSIPMSITSTIIAKLWAKEPQSVKNECKKLAKEAKEIYNIRHSLKHKFDLSTFGIIHENTTNTSNITMPNTTNNTLNMTLSNTTNLVFVELPTPKHSMLEYDYDHAESEHAESNTNFNLDYSVLINAHISSSKIDGVNQNDCFF